MMWAVALANVSCLWCNWLTLKFTFFLNIKLYYSLCITPSAQQEQDTELSLPRCSPNTAKVTNLVELNLRVWFFFTLMARSSYTLFSRKLIRHSQSIVPVISVPYSLCCLVSLRSRCRKVWDVQTDKHMGNRFTLKSCFSTEVESLSFVVLWAHTERSNGLCHKPIIIQR